MTGFADVPGATLLYLGFYATTLWLHLVAMSYVLAGSLWLAASAVFGGGTPPQSRSPAALLRDWLPFALGAAITAGVAPLLFVQILYQTQFYSASLLLGNRWLLVLPTLVLGFYLLYVQKSPIFDVLRARWRAAIAVTTAACFVYIAWSWTQNHLIALDASAWPRIYQSTSALYVSWPNVPRVSAWVFGAFGVLAWIVTLQLEHAGAHEPQTWRRLARMALGGGGLAAASAVVYVGTGVDPHVYDALAAGWIWLAGLGAGLLLQLIGWWPALFGRPPASKLITTGVSSALMSTILLREVIRMASVDMTALVAQHQQAMTQGGLPLFVFFLVINGGLTVWVIRSRRGVAGSKSE